MAAMEVAMAIDPNERPRRFYTAVDVVAHGGGFAVTLDARLVKTPAKRELTLATRALADVVAAEWEAQGERIVLDQMHATRLVNVALDRAPEHRVAIAQEVARYAETDLVCHLADATPDLTVRQEAVWAPLRAWAGETIGLALTPTAGVLPCPQPEASLAAARREAEGLDDVNLVSLAHATALLGSAVLAFAMLRRRLDAPGAFAASRIDETYQEEKWGVDADAQARAAALGDEIAVVERVMRAVAG